MRKIKIISDTLTGLVLVLYMISGISKGADPPEWSDSVTKVERAMNYAETNKVEALYIGDDYSAVPNKENPASPKIYKGYQPDWVMVGHGELEIVPSENSQKLADMVTKKINTLRTEGLAQALKGAKITDRMRGWRVLVSQLKTGTEPLQEDSMLAWAAKNQSEYISLASMETPFSRHVEVDGYEQTSNRERYYKSMREYEGRGTYPAAIKEIDGKTYLSSLKHVDSLSTKELNDKAAWIVYKLVRDLDNIAEVVTSPRYKNITVRCTISACKYDKAETEAWAHIIATVIIIHT